VPALVVVPKGKGPFPGVVVQHGLPDTKEGMLPAGIDLARTGAVAVLIDAPFNRPGKAASVPTRSPSPPRTVMSRSSLSWTCAGPWTS
jgi:dienelactone hydrolase